MEWWRVLYRGIWQEVSVRALIREICTLTKFHIRFERELEALRKELAEVSQARTESMDETTSIGFDEDSVPPLTRGNSDLSNYSPRLGNHEPLPPIESVSGPSFDGLQMKAKKEQ